MLPVFIYTRLRQMRWAFYLQTSPIQQNLGNKNNHFISRFVLHTASSFPELAMDLIGLKKERKKRTLWELAKRNKKYLLTI